MSHGPEAAELWLGEAGELLLLPVGRLTLLLLLGAQAKYCLGRAGPLGAALHGGGPTCEPRGLAEGGEGGRELLEGGGAEAGLY